MCLLKCYLWAGGYENINKFQKVHFLLESKCKTLWMVAILKELWRHGCIHTNTNTGRMSNNCSGFGRSSSSGSSSGSGVAVVVVYVVGVAVVVAVVVVWW